HASDVVTRALDPDSTSTELARIVLKDLGLASLLLRVANSARYNRSGRPVMSVTHAIILLGWDTVRNLVGTVRYIEYFAAGGGVEPAGQPDSMGARIRKGDRFVARPVARLHHRLRTRPDACALPGRSGH